MNPSLFRNGPRWPVHPLPQADELLSSYLIRIARAHGTRPPAFWTAVAGVTRWLDLDLQKPSPELVHALVEGIGLEPRRIHAMTLTSFAQYGVLPGGEGRFIAFCPECLKEPIPYYRRGWCVEFMSFCGTHSLVLQKACPPCRALVRFERLSLDQAFTNCHNCGFNLRNASARKYEPVDKLRTVATHQDRLVRLLNRPL